MEADFDQIPSVGNIRRPTFFTTLQAAAKTDSIHWYDAADGIDYPLESQWIIGRIFHAFTDGALHWMRKLIPSGSGGTFAGNCVRLFAGFVQEAEPKHLGDETADGDGNVLAHDGALWVNPVNGLARVQDNTNQPDATAGSDGVQQRWIPVRPSWRSQSVTATASLDVSTMHLLADATGSASFTLTLPAAADNPGWWCRVVLLADGGHTITLSDPNGALVLGANPYVLNTNFAGWLATDGTTWSAYV